MGVLDSAIRGVTATLIQQFGQTVVLKSIVTGVFNSATDTVGTTEVQVSLKGVISEFTKEEVFGLVESGDKKVLVAASDVLVSGSEVMPDTNWKLQIGSVWHEIVQVSVTHSGDEAALLTIAARGQ